MGLRPWRRLRVVDAPKANHEPVRPRGRFYGGDGTIHGSQHLDIEVSSEGEVLGVWYRCQMLAFEQHLWHPSRGVGIGQGAKITGVEVLDDGS